MLLTGCCTLGNFLRSNQEIQTYAIALINALFLKAPEDRRQVSELLTAECVALKKITEYTEYRTLSCTLQLFPHVTS